MATYGINKGVGKEVEFKGLTSQYLFLFVGGLLGLFILVAIMVVAGINQWLSMIIGILMAGVFVYLIFRLNRKYGRHGLMKLTVSRRVPRRIINRKKVTRMIRWNGAQILSKSNHFMHEK